VHWDEDARQAVDATLSESDVLGIRPEPSSSWCDLLLHVLALPEAGPIDPDARRILRLTLPAQVSVLLRTETFVPRTGQMGSVGFGPVIPLADLDAVEDFFASLTWWESMCGWKFLDDQSLTDDWPDQPSLTLDVRRTAGSHLLYGFNECGPNEGSTTASYCIEGTVTFEDLEVLRADETPQPLAEFIADGRRYWHALHGRDERLSVEAQRAAQARTPSWRCRTSRTP